MLANDEFDFLDATFDSVELGPSCRYLFYGPETITETTLDFVLEFVPYGEQLCQLQHLGPLKAPRSLCQRFHVSVHNANIYLTLRHGSNVAPSSLPFTGRGLFCFISSLLYSAEEPTSLNTLCFEQEEYSVRYAIIIVFVDPYEA